MNPWQVTCLQSRCLPRRHSFRVVFPLYAVFKFSGVVEEQEGGQEGVGMYSGVKEECKNNSLRDWLTWLGMGCGGWHVRSLSGDWGGAQFAACIWRQEATLAVAGHLLYSKSFTNGSLMLKYLRINNSMETGQTVGGWLNQSDPELTIHIYDVQFFSAKDCLFKVNKIMF